MSTAAAATSRTKGARTRIRILDAAARVIREKGYSAASLGDIAEAAGLKTGSLYFHFPAKDDLVGQMLAYGITVTMDQIRSAVAELGPDASAERRIRVAIETHLAGLHTQNDYAAAVLRTIDQFPASARAGVREAERAYFRFWRRLVADAQQQGHTPAGLDPTLLAALLLGAMNSTWDRTRARRRPPPQLTETLLAMLGIRIAPGTR